MPAAFDACVKRGGKIRTIRLPKNRYQRVCVSDGKEFKGEVKKRKSV